MRQEVPVLLEQILDGELVMLEGLPDARIRYQEFNYQRVVIAANTILKIHCVYINFGKLHG